jgi:lactoylglutathione lyase
MDFGLMEVPSYCAIPAASRRTGRSIRQKYLYKQKRPSTVSSVKRLVLVSPRGSNGTKLLLAKVDSPEQESRIGNQTGGRVFLFLHTDDFWRDYHEMKSQGVQFHEEAYGTVLVFSDLYGNKWDLLKLKKNGG